MTMMEGIGGYCFLVGSAAQFSLGEMSSLSFEILFEIDSIVLTFDGYFVCCAFER